VPFLFGRGSTMHRQPGASYNPREHGLTVRGTAIADARPVVAVGRTADGVGAGFSGLAIGQALWCELGVPAAQFPATQVPPRSILVTVAADGSVALAMAPSPQCGDAAAAPRTGLVSPELLAMHALGGLAEIGQALVGPAPPTAQQISPARSVAAIAAPGAGTLQVIGFGALACEDPAAPGQPCTIPGSVLLTRLDRVAAANASASPSVLRGPGWSGALASHLAFFSAPSTPRPLLAPVLVR
jgi:hypothetical protein